MKMKNVFAIFAAVMLFAGTAYADNTATATSGTTSEQEQGQSQGIVQDQLNDSFNMFNDSFNSEGKRGFGIPGEVNYGPVIGTYHKPNQSYGFQNVEDLVMYTCWFTEGSLENMLKGVEDVESEFKVATKAIDDAHPAVEDENVRWIKIVVQKEKVAGPNVQFKGYTTTWSEDPDTTMTEVMAKAALEALQNGCNIIHFKAQGAVRDVIASGWGIGFNTTQAQIYGGGEDRSNATSAGMGYSHAEAGTRDMAWLQGFGLIDQSLTYPALRIPAVEEEMQTGNHTDKPIVHVTPAD